MLLVPNLYLMPAPNYPAQPTRWLPGNNAHWPGQPPIHILLEEQQAMLGVVLMFSSLSHIYYAYT